MERTPVQAHFRMAGRLGFFPSFEVKLGGNQIEHEDEDPVVPQMFYEACDKAGVQNLMILFPACVAMEKMHPLCHSEREILSQIERQDADSVDRREKVR